MTQSTHTLVEYKDVTLAYDGRVILSEVNFSIEKGGFCYLVGRTGGGKSSLLKTVYADNTITSGTAQVSGFDIVNLTQNQVPALRRKLGIIFQDFQLLFDRSVFENLSFVLRSTGWKDIAKIKHRVQEVLLRVGLPNASNRMPHQLSGGEQQRVAIARALLNEPSLLIADEPTGNLDPEVSHEIMKIFQAVNNSGTAILMATHNHLLIKEFPGRVLQCANQTLKEISIDQLLKIPVRFN